jgi:hypothetical protein
VKSATVDTVDVPRMALLDQSKQSGRKHIPPPLVTVVAVTLVIVVSVEKVDVVVMSNVKVV